MPLHYGTSDSLITRQSDALPSELRAVVVEESNVEEGCPHSTGDWLPLNRLGQKLLLHGDDPWLTGSQPVVLPLHYNSWGVSRILGSNQGPSAYETDVITTSPTRAFLCWVMVDGNRSLNRGEVRSTSKEWSRFRGDSNSVLWFQRPV
jgi:hypothetical protein